MFIFRTKNINILDSLSNTSDNIMISYENTKNLKSKALFVNRLDFKKRKYLFKVIKKI